MVLRSARCLRRPRHKLKDKLRHKLRRKLRRKPVLDSAGGKPALPLEMGRQRTNVAQRNHQKPAAVLNAAKLIKTGEVIELAHVLGPSMAFFGTRRFDVHTKRTFMNQFSNMRGSNEEIIITELGQVGTQFDGFAHQTHLKTAGTIASRSTRTRPAPASTSSAFTMSAHCSRAA